MEQHSVPSVQANNRDHGIFPLCTLSILQQIHCGIQLRAKMAAFSPVWSFHREKEVLN
jgi:hypothetical protein